MSLKSFFLVFILFFAPLSVWTKEKNYYETLGISQTATQEEIRKAYRQQAQKWHPDKHPEAQDTAKEKFQEIQKAYEVLKDSHKRQRYDQFGHQNWTSSAQTQTKDFYSESFKDIFKKTDRVSQRPISQKSLYLFKKLILLKNYKTETEINMSVLDTALKQLLVEFKIFDFNKATAKKIRERILRDIAPSYIQEVKGIIELNMTDKQEEEYLKQSLGKFITELENRYVVEEITSKERQAVELFYQLSFFNQRLNDFLTKQKRQRELLTKEQEKRITKEEERELNRFRKEENKDTRVFRKILSALGLPGQTHHEFLLRSYLDALKNSLLNEKYGEKLLTSKSVNSHHRFYMEDREILKALKTMKTAFDSIHYENLKTMSNPFKFNFLKNFPGQFIIFQAAIGASLYRQVMSDPYFYGAERNPGLLLETVKHGFTPSGVASFFIFVAVSQQMNYRLYGWGRKLDGKSFGKVSSNGKLLRSVAPGAGLGLGYFASVIFDELIVRDPHLVPCAKTLYKTAPVELIRDHTSPCENFYNNWSRGEKWKHYAVDIVTLIGSGILSHKFINSALYAIRLTSAGSNLLIGITKKMGLRVIGWAGFFVHMYFFMEFHKVLDKYLGQPVKEHLSAGETKNSVMELTNYLNQDLYALLSSSELARSYPSGQLKEYFSERLKKAEGRIKALGAKFASWANIAGQNYNQSAHLWIQQTNQLLLPYEASSRLLKDLFILSRFNYNFPVVDNQSWDSDKQVNEDSVEYWKRLNELARFETSTFERDIEYYRKKYCLQIDDSFSLWNNFCLNSTGFFENGEFKENYNTALFFETAQLIYNHLQTISLGKNYNLNPINYIGMENNELFSSDPQYSVESFSYEPRNGFSQEIQLENYDKKFALSRMLIKAGLNWENSLSYLSSDQSLKLKSEMCADFFPNYNTDPDSEKLYQYCYNSSAYLIEIEKICQDWYPDTQEAYESCTEFFDSSGILKENWGLKILSAGVYLLKDIISELERKGYLVYNNQSVINDIQIFQPVLDLIESMEVYKKGEQKFVLDQEYFVQKKNQLDNKEEKDYLEKQFELENPYVLVKNMICGSRSPNRQEEDFLFSSNKFFKSDSLLMYHFSSKEYQPIDRICKNLINKNSSIHSFLFDIPAQLEGKNYENLYLTLEELFKDYSSSQEVKQAFRNLSQDQLDDISGQISQDLELVTENYYKDMIELESSVHSESSLKDFLNYYDKNRILWDIRSFTGGLKGLEVSIFQVNYWLDTLKKLLLAGEQAQLNKVFNGYEEEFEFNQEEFESMQKEVLSLFQSYNDTFKKAQGPYFTFPDKKQIEKIRKNLEEANNRKTSVLDKLKQDSSYPLRLNPELILSHVLAHSIPSWNNSGLIAFIQMEKTFLTEWEQLIVSVLTELNNSLVNFFNQLGPLQLKEDFEDQVAGFQENELREAN